MNKECSDCGTILEADHLYAFCSARRADGRRCESVLCSDCQYQNGLMMLPLCCWAHIREIAGIKTDQDCDRSEVE